MTFCVKCSRQDLPVSPLHDDRGGPLFCPFCAGAWHAEYTRRRKWGRIIIKAMKMYEKEGGAWADFDKMKLAVAGWDVAGFEADTIGAEIGEITSELLASTVELTHPDRHPPERRELTIRVTQELLALKPFVFPAPKPKPVSTPGPSNTSLTWTHETVTEPLWCTYPCELCHDTVPRFYCDPCKAEWKKRLQHRVAELRGMLLPVREAFPKSATACNNLAWAYASMGQHLDEAERLARLALTLAPDEPGYVDTLAEVLFRKGQRNKAIALERGVLWRLPVDRTEFYRRQIRRFESGKPADPLE